MVLIWFYKLRITNTIITKKLNFQHSGKKHRFWRKVCINLIKIYINLHSANLIADISELEWQHSLLGQSSCYK